MPEPGTLRLVDPDGQERDVTPDMAASLLQDPRWRVSQAADSAERVAAQAAEVDYGGAANALKATAAGVARGVTVGLSDVAARALGGEDAAIGLQGLREQHPAISTGAEILGAAAPVLLSGGSAAPGVLARTPAGLTSSLGRTIVESAGTGLGSRVAASTLGAAAEGAIYGGGQYLSEVALENRPLSAEGFVAGMGHGALFAAPIGGALTLGGAALQRARSLFPRHEVSAAAAKGVQQDASTQLAQSVADGDAMVAAAQRRIQMLDAKAGQARAGEGVTRRVFGGADPAALGDQVAAGAERAQVSEAIGRYEASKARLQDWVRAEADDDLEAALRALDPGTVQGKGAPLYDLDMPTQLDRDLGKISPVGVQRDLVPVGEFGAPGARAAKSQEELAALAAGSAPAAAAPAGSTRVLRGGPKPFNASEFDAYKANYGHAAQDHIASEFWYSKGGDELINPALRSGKEITGDVAKMRDGLDSAFALPEARLPREATLYRGLSDDPILGKTGNNARLANVKPGDVLEDPAYTSTTYNEKSKFRNEQIVFTIKAPAGFPAIPVRSKFGMSEGELLLPRGTKMRVESIDYVPISDRWTLREAFEVLPDKSVRVGETVYPPIKDIKVTLINEHAPPAVRPPPVGLDAPVEKLSVRQLGEYQAKIREAFDGVPEGSPEYKALSDKWDAAVNRRNAYSDGLAKPPEVEYAPAPAAPAASDSLTGLLRGTQEKLASGEGLVEMGAPARAEYAAAKAERTAEAADHFRALAREKNYAGSAMAAEEQATRQHSFEDLGLTWDAKARAYRGDIMPPPVNDLSIGLLPRAEPSGVSAAEFAGRAAETKIGRRIVEAAIEPPPPPLEALAARVIEKRIGADVDMGPFLTRAAKAIGDHEDALAHLVDAVGIEAPASAVARAQAYRAAVAAQADVGAIAAARLAGDAGSKISPGDVETAAAATAAHITGDIGRSTVSKAVDAGAALEVLRALGVRVPGVGAIPVIGPVLSAVLKARAVMGIIGRKGGSIGKSTESLIASKAAAVQDRITAATTALLTAGARGATKAASFAAAPAVLLSTPLFAGGRAPKGKDVRALYEARIDEISRAMQPGAIDHAIGDRYHTSDPRMHDAVVAQVMRGIAFLDSKVPKQTVMPGVLPGDGEWKPSKAAIEEFARYVHAVNDPASVLEDLSRGHVTLEGAETLRVVYPELYALAQRTLIEAAPRMQVTLPYARRVAISIMYQVPIDGTLTSDHARYLKGAAQPAQPRMPAPAPGAPAITGPMRAGQQTMSALDRRAGA